MKISELPNTEKPREKALHYGIENCTTLELLAILLHTGTKNADVYEVACNLLNSLTSIGDMRQISPDKLASIKGVGIAKATTILAGIELGKRLTLEENKKRKKIQCGIDVWKHLRAYTLEKQEHLIVLFLNTKKEILATKVVFKGSAQKSIVDPRDILREALNHAAVSLIIAHNHPSGDPTPSKEDIALTRRMREACLLCGIPLVDHIILGQQSFYSFYEEKIIPLEREML